MSERKTFDLNGRTWTEHRPGDPMPCRSEDKVFILMRSEKQNGAVARECLSASRVLWRAMLYCPAAEVVGWCFEGSAGNAKGTVVKSSERLRVSGDEARIIIVNCHRLVGKTHRFHGVPLWSLVSEVTSHGCGYSCDICVSANLDPQQKCGVKLLRDFNGRQP